MHLVVLTQVLDRDDAVLGFFHGWCAALAREVERLTVVAQSVGVHDLPAHVEVVSLGRERGAGRLVMWWRMNRVLRRLARAAPADAILAHMVPRFVLSVAATARAQAVPLYLWYTHGSVDRSLRLATPLVAKVFTASPESFRLAAPPGKVVVTGHGIDTDHFAPGAGPRPVDVLAVGRIAPSKGQHELLEALGRLSCAPATTIAGDVLLERDVPYREDCKARAAERFGAAVTFAGAVPWPRVAELMRGARVLVSTSRTGSVDKAVLEAMAAGCLPLTCNESFAPILGAELGARLTFAPGDVAGLAQKLQALLDLPEAEAAALGQRLRALVVAHHDLRRLAPRLVAEMSPADAGAP